MSVLFLCWNTVCVVFPSVPKRENRISIEMCCATCFANRWGSAAVSIPTVEKNPILLERKLIKPFGRSVSLSIFLDFFAMCPADSVVVFSNTIYSRQVILSCLWTTNLLPSSTKKNIAREREREKRRKNEPKSHTLWDPWPMDERTTSSVTV